MFQFDSAFYQLRSYFRILKTSKKQNVISLLTYFMFLKLAFEIIVEENKMLGNGFKEVSPVLVIFTAAY